MLEKPYDYQKEDENFVEQIKLSKSPNLEKYFATAKEYIKMVGFGYINSLILLGNPGTGKTFTVLQCLSENNIPFNYHSGVSSPLALYNYLYEHRSNEVIVFDDVANLLANENAISIILNALYSPTGKRKLSWNTTSAKCSAPEQYEFTSRIIFISNSLPQDGYARSILSRCLIYEFDFKYPEILDIMFEIAKLPHPKLTKEERIAIVDFIKDNTDETTENFDLRLQTKIENLYLFNKEKWKVLALPLLKKKNDKLVLIKELLNSGKPVKEQLQVWIHDYGFSRRSYFYNKKLLRIRNGEKI